MYDYRTVFARGLVAIGLAAGLAAPSLHAQDAEVMSAHRANYEANHPWFNFSTAKQWFAHPTERTPCGMNGWGNRYRNPQLYMLFLNSNNGPGPTRYSCQEVTGSNWPLKAPRGPFPPAHAPTKAFEFEKDIAEDK